MGMRQGWGSCQRLRSPKKIDSADSASLPTPQRPKGPRAQSLASGWFDWMLWVEWRGAFWELSKQLVPCGKPYFSLIGVSINGVAGWFIRENPTKMDDLGVPLFSEPPCNILRWMESFHLWNGRRGHGQNFTAWGSCFSEESSGAFETMWLVTFRQLLKRSWLF